MRFFPQHRVGLLVPSANPAVEPEFRQLLPESVALHATRLPTYPGSSLADRTAAYVSAYPAALQSFGELQLDAAAVAVTGPSYALSQQEDLALANSLAAARGCPVVLASRAIFDVVAHLGLSRVALFSPYPGWLSDQAEEYWRAAGLDVAQVFKVSEEFRAYDLTPREVVQALARMDPPEDCAVIMSGTGMATLDALAELAPRMPQALLPSNLCTCWSLLRALKLPPPGIWQSVAPPLAH
jgi:maleate isomerase